MLEESLVFLVGLSRMMGNLLQKALVWLWQPLVVGGFFGLWSGDSSFLSLAL